ncbi:hypothetical protein R3I94_000401 [Phoxinus phoxinus]
MSYSFLHCDGQARISAAVIKVFKGEELQPNELYSLSQNTRWLLRANMGFFIKEYFQNQILTKGLSIILDEIQKHEGESGERQLFVLAQVWDRFFSEILPTLQAILYPLQSCISWADDDYWMLWDKVIDWGDATPDEIWEKAVDLSKLDG